MLKPMLPGEAMSPVGRWELIYWKVTGEISLLIFSREITGGDRPLFYWRAAIKLGSQYKLKTNKQSINEVPVVLSLTETITIVY